MSPELRSECVAFYEALGFSEVQPPETLRERAAWLERLGTQVHLLWVDSPAILPEGHFAVIVEDFEDVLAALVSAGHEPERRREHWGSPRAVVRDPAGNLVELMASPP